MYKLQKTKDKEEILKKARVGKKTAYPQWDEDKNDIRIHISNYAHRRGAE